MSGDVQPRKRKDKKRRRGNEKRSEIYSRIWCVCVQKSIRFTIVQLLLYELIHIPNRNRI